MHKNLKFALPVIFKLKIILSLLIISFSFFTAKSQTHYSSNISLGVRAGADLSRLFFNPSVKQVFKPGALAGVTFRYIEESHFGIIAEINYEQRGWKENFEGKPFSYSRTLDYIQIPVLAHIYFGRRGRFFANVGPEIGIRISDKIKTDFDTGNTENLSDFPKFHNILQYSEPIKQRVDYGISAGLGGEFNITPKNSICLEVRFYYGLGNLYGSSKKDNFNASNSMALQFTLGYWLRIK